MDICVFLLAIKASVTIFYFFIFFKLDYAKVRIVVKMLDENKEDKM